MDILDRIDAAVGCQQCGGELGESPSDDFCSPEHQRAWHIEHVEPLPWSPDAALVYVEADHLAVPLTEPFAPARRFYLNTWVAARPTPSRWCAGEACTEIISRDRNRCPACDLAHRQANWRLPRQTGNLMADIRACNRARDAASTDAQRAAVQVRTEQLAERSREPFRHVQEAFAGMAQAASEALQQIRRELCRAMGLPELPESTGDDQRDRMAAALEARRNRNTGPQRRPNAPRVIGRPTTAGRR